MLKVTLEFASVDEAIVALSQLAGTSPARSGPVRPAPVAEALANRPRRGRSDKGQPRGSHKEPDVPGELNRGASLAKVLEATAAPAVATPAAPAVAIDPQPAARPAADPTLKIGDAQSAIAKLFEAKGMETCMHALSRYGVQAVRDMKPEHYAPFIADATAILAGAAA